jgi:hypothetical protein
MAECEKDDIRNTIVSCPDAYPECTYSVNERIRV